MTVLQEPVRCIEEIFGDRFREITITCAVFGLFFSWFGRTAERLFIRKIQTF
ncbi:hypothetical protein O0S10_07745 [Methanocorpusculum sp. MG]|uniref:Uncharacterized protein n=1 Tax=Methanocorpusculum petauri TaxID=3002863 RepID=A0ABT4IH93_9EURY|nr:hypothetical protein [Methanocorpusculum petauri]MCZ0861115.1 hypothetical protein [Methanocorpusculum petauri]MDE2444137.1 hypothetical protein [Methanocorpusculum sp.]